MSRSTYTKSPKRATRGLSCFRQVGRTQLSLAPTAMPHHSEGILFINESPLNNAMTQEPRLTVEHNARVHAARIGRFRRDSKESSAVRSDRLSFVLSTPQAWPGSRPDGILASAQTQRRRRERQQHDTEGAGPDLLPAISPVYGAACMNSITPKEHASAAEAARYCEYSSRVTQVQPSDATASL